MDDNPQSGVRLLNEESSPSVITIPKANSVTEKEKFPQPPLLTRLRAISRAAHVPIYCEYFPAEEAQWNGSNLILHDKGSLASLLNETARRYNYNVVKKDDAYFLWSKTWFLDRPNLLPENQLTTWRQSIENDTPLTIEELFSLATLSRGQFAMAERMGWDLPVSAGKAPVLQSIAALNDRQRALVETSDGLSLRQLTKINQDAVLNAFGLAPGEPEAASRNSRVYLEQSSVVGSETLSISIAVGEEKRRKMTFPLRCRFRKESAVKVASP